MKHLTISLVDLNAELTAAWAREFAPYGAVAVVTGSIFEVRADAIVSPANSFGIMDGGLDGKLRDFFGLGIERAVRHRIGQDYFGELPVGLALVVPTEHPAFRHLICAPTMRFPEDVSRTIHAYLAMKAILNVGLAHPEISSIAIPGLCSLSGRMPPQRVARQMRIAYERVIHGHYAYTHWREEKAFVDFILGNVLAPPEDLNLPRGYGMRR